MDTTNTIRVRRANVILDIKPEEKTHYMNKGYSVIDMQGNVLEEVLSDDANELKVMIAALRKENDELKAEIAKLKAPAKSEVVTETKPVTETKSTTRRKAATKE